MPKYVDLLLVNPGNRLEQFAKLHELATVAQPLGIAMLAAVARSKGVSVEIFDAEVEFMTPGEAVKNITENWEPLVIGLTAFTTKMTAAEGIIRGVKENLPHVYTVLGGHHASADPNDPLQDATLDFVISGEAFEPMVELVTALKEKKDTSNIRGLWWKQGEKTVGNGRASGPGNLDELPYAAWDLLPMEKYRSHHWHTWDYDLEKKGYAVIYTSLGCPFSCSFCSVNVVYGKRGTRFRSAKHVVGEIKFLVDSYGIRDFEIVDDLFTVNPTRVAEFCDEVIGQGLGDKINIWCFGRTDTVSDKLCNHMKRAGINWVFMGIESGSDHVLDTVGKKQTLQKIHKASEVLRRTGIHFGGNFIFGLPEDTRESMQMTIDLACELNPVYANFFLAMAYPGTSLYGLAKTKGYRLPEKWGQYGFFAPDSVPLRNENLTSEEILDFRDSAFETFYRGQRYQDQVRDIFGEHTLEFLNQKVLAKKIERIHRMAP
ncbi:MAG: radical SAM protein [Methylococcaceae bacterium]